jgi:hypothetical protein
MKKEKKFDKLSILYIIREQLSKEQHFGDVAQPVEQRPFKAKVPGSNPGISTTYNKKIPFRSERDFSLVLHPGINWIAIVINLLIFDSSSSSSMIFFLILWTIFLRVVQKKREISLLTLQKIQKLATFCLS